MAIDYAAIPGLSEEQITALTSAHNTDVSNLIINRDNIKQEKLGVQERLTAAEQVAEDARKTATLAKEAELIAAGKTEELKLHYEEQLATTTAELTATAKTAKDALTSRDRGDVMGKVMGLVHDDHKWNSEAMLSNMLEIGYNDQQQLTTSFKHNGEVVANNVDEFKSWAGEQDSFKKILKGVDSSGADTTQSRSGSATNGNDTQTKLAQRLRAAGINK
ncbi:MAG: hypothetical protein KAJ19_25290 [Gammaproteobacteria bacterium]|nr:hypothetical protein [Gammaproteobacteria bacterium]